MPARTHSGFFVLLAVLFGTGCQMGFNERSQLEDYRVVGLQSEPAEVQSATGTVTLRLADFVPHEKRDEALDYTWAVCLFSIGSAATYECTAALLDSSLEAFYRTESPELTLDLGPDGYDLIGKAARACEAARALEDDEVREGATAVFCPEEQSIPTESEDNCDTDQAVDPIVSLTVRVFSGAETTASVDSVGQIRVRLGPGGNAPNLNPEIADISLARENDTDGCPTTDPARFQLEMTLADGSNQQYFDRDACEEAEEELLVGWFTSAGGVDPERSVDDLSTTLEISEVPSTDVDVIGVVRDGRGGFDWRVVTIPRSTFDPDPACAN